MLPQALYFRVAITFLDIGIFARIFKTLALAEKFAALQRKSSFVESATVLPFSVCV